MNMLEQLINKIDTLDATKNKLTKKLDYKKEALDTELEVAFEGIDTVYVFHIHTLQPGWISE